VDLAVIAGLRYARSLHPTDLRAVHFVVDQTRAEHLRERWLRSDLGVELDLIDCPDRRLERAAADLVARETGNPGTHVTVVLPRRSYPPLLGRLMHDRTADKIARVTSRIPHSAATIVPFDVTAKIQGHAERDPDPGYAVPRTNGSRNADDHPSAPQRERRGRRVVAGRVHTVKIRPVEQSSILECTISGADGDITALFYGRTHIPGLEPGSHVKLTGAVSENGGSLIMINPAYELTE
jgi:hypothetical protein